jgi:hypothetical protein
MKRLLFGLDSGRRLGACGRAVKDHFEVPVCIREKPAERFLAFLRETISQALSVEKITLQNIHVERLAFDGSGYDLVGPAQKIKGFFECMDRFIRLNRHTSSARSQAIIAQLVNGGLPQETKRSFA